MFELLKIVAFGFDPPGVDFHSASRRGRCMGLFQRCTEELGHAGRVVAERDGRHLVYRAAISEMNDWLGFLTAHGCQGQPCLASFSALDWGQR